MTQAQPLYVALGVISICGIAAMPLWFQSVRRREQLLAQARWELEHLMQRVLARLMVQGDLMAKWASRHDLNNAYAETNTMIRSKVMVAMQRMRLAVPG